VRLALLTDRPHSTYGAELNLLAIGDLAAEAGHEVTAVSIEPGAFVDAATRRSMRTLVVPTPPSLTAMWSGGLRPTPRTLAAMARFGHTLHAQMRAHGADVVITSSVRAAAMSWAGRFRRPHSVWYIQMRTPPSLEAAAAAIAANRMATIAAGVEASIPAPIRRIRRRRIHPLPPCRDIQSFANPSPASSPAGRLRVVTVGKVTPRKGLTLLIDAIATARAEGAEVTLTVVGAPTGPDDEAYAASARSQAQDLAVPVHWAGWHDDVAPLLADADAFALVSEREGLPGAVVEAMAAGLAVVVSDTGPVAALIEGSGSGLVAPTGDIDAVASHLVTLATRPAQREAMGRRAVRAAERFSPEETKLAIDAILNAMGPSRSRPGRGSSR